MEVERKNYERQIDIVTPSELSPITIIGCGAVGSALGILATKLGVQTVCLYDGDIVEEHNIPNQYFGYEYLGWNKAEALAEEMKRYAPEDMQPTIIAINEMFRDDHGLFTPIVMLGLDSLEARRNVMHTLKNEPRVRWVIDTRMAGQFWQIKTVDMSDEEEYFEYLEGIRPDTKVVEAPCTARSIIYTVATASSHAINMLKKISKGELDEVPKVMYESLGDYRFPRTIGFRKGIEENE